MTQHFEDGAGHPRPLQWELRRDSVRWPTLHSIPAGFTVAKVIVPVEGKPTTMYQTFDVRDGHAKSLGVYPWQDQAKARAESEYGRPVPIARALAGLLEAGDHANAVSEGWVERAAHALRQHALARPEGFIVEEVSRTFHEPPPDRRAWGAATRFAQKQGWITRAGYTTEGTTNACAKPVWKAAQQAAA